MSFPTTAGTGFQSSCRHVTLPWNKLSPFFVFFIWFQSAGRFSLEQAREVGLHITQNIVDLFYLFIALTGYPTVPEIWAINKCSFPFASSPARCPAVLPATLQPSESVTIQVFNCNDGPVTNWSVERTVWSCWLWRSWMFVAFVKGKGDGGHGPNQAGRGCK